MNKIKELHINDKMSSIITKFKNDTYLLKVNKVINFKSKAFSNNYCKWNFSIKKEIDSVVFV